MKPAPCRATVATTGVRPASNAPHRGDKPLREALHLADLIHNVDSGAWVWRKQCRSFIDCGHVHTILPDAVALREGGMRDNTLLPLKAQQPKSASLSTLPDLLRIEASQLSQLELRDNAPDHRRFADPRRPCEQKRVRPGSVTLFGCHLKLQLAIWGPQQPRTRSNGPNTSLLPPVGAVRARNGDTLGEFGAGWLGGLLTGYRVPRAATLQWQCCPNRIYVCEPPRREVSRSTSARQHALWANADPAFPEAHSVRSLLSS
jgi:hypothetical protein